MKKVASKHINEVFIEIINDEENLNFSIKIQHRVRVGIHINDFTTIKNLIKTIDNQEIEKKKIATLLHRKQ